VLLILALLVALIALGGGVAVHPLLFLLLLIAAIMAFSHTRSGAVL